MKTEQRIEKYIGEGKAAENDAYNELSGVMKGVDIKPILKAANKVFPKKVIEIHLWDIILNGLAKRLVKEK
jgi:hypothetical protein